MTYRVPKFSEADAYPVSHHNEQAALASAMLADLEAEVERWKNEASDGLAQLASERADHEETKAELAEAKRQVLEQVPRSPPPKELEALLFKSATLNCAAMGAPHDLEWFVNKANGSIRAAHTIGDAAGYERGKREAEKSSESQRYCEARDRIAELETELKRLREAAPKDDGARFEIWLRLGGGGDERSADYPGEYSKDQSDAICLRKTCRYTARPVAPKHVHKYESWVDATSENPRRTCKCGHTQVAEWRDVEKGGE